MAHSAKMTMRGNFFKNQSPFSPWFPSLWVLGPCKNEMEVTTLEDEKIIGLYFDRSEEALKATDQKYGN